MEKKKLLSLLSVGLVSTLLSACDEDKDCKAGDESCGPAVNAGYIDIDPVIDANKVDYDDIAGENDCPGPENGCGPASESEGVTAPTENQNSEILNPDNCTSEELDLLGTAPDLSRVITGTVFFEDIPHNPDGSLNYANITQMPAIGAAISAQACDGSLIEQDGLNLGVVLYDGSFQLRVPASVSISINSIRANSSWLLGGVITVDKATGETAVINSSYEISVVDNTNANEVYSYDSGISVAAGADVVSGLSVVIPSGWDASSQSYNSDRASAPFAILRHSISAIGSWIDVIGDQRNADGSIKAYAETITSGTGKRGDGVNFGTVTVAWSSDNVTQVGDVALGEIGASHYDGEMVYLLGEEGVNTDEFDGDVIARNLVHLLVDKQVNDQEYADFSGVYQLNDQNALINVSAATYGVNEFSAKLDPVLAFREGFAIGYAVGTSSTGEGVYRDSRGPQVGSTESLAIALEAQGDGVTTNAGWFNEMSVAALVYDLLDSPENDDDNISMVSFELIEAIAEAAESTSLRTVFSFANAVKRTVFDAYPGVDGSEIAFSMDQNTAMDAILLAQGMHIVDGRDDHLVGDEYVDGRSVISDVDYGAFGYDGASATVLTHLGEFGYPSAPSNKESNSTTVCSINTHGLQYYLGNRQYVAFTVYDKDWFLSTASYSDAKPDIDLTIERVSGVPNARLAVALYHHGVLVNTAAGDAAGADLFQATESLLPGGYVLEISHFGNLGLPINTSQPDVVDGEVCYEVTIADADITKIETIQ